MIKKNRHFVSYIFRLFVLSFLISENGFGPGWWWKMSVSRAAYASLVSREKKHRSVSKTRSYKKEGNPGEVQGGLCDANWKVGHSIIEWWKKRFLIDSNISAIKTKARRCSNTQYATPSNCSFSLELTLVRGMVIEDERRRNVEIRL